MPFHHALLDASVGHASKDTIIFIIATTVLNHYINL